MGRAGAHLARPRAPRGETAAARRALLHAAGAGGTRGGAAGRDQHAERGGSWPEARASVGPAGQRVVSHNGRPVPVTWPSRLHTWAGLGQQEEEESETGD
jgi:hypothetical protein